MSKVYSAIVGDNIRVYIADTTQMVKDAAKIHNTSEISTKALGRTLTATSLLGKLLKNKKDVLTVKVAGTNQIKGILVTTNFAGDVKGYISNPNAEVYNQPKDKIGEAIGRGGSITVIRDFGLKEPYVGISHLLSAEIDDDIAFYYKHSEQQPTVMKLNVKVDQDTVLAAGGILIQYMPDASIEEKAAVEIAEEKIQDVVEKLHDGMSAEAIIQSYFNGFDVKMTGDFDVNFKCDCSEERIARALLSVGRDELKEILEVDQQAELKCHFCNTTYHFGKDQLEEMIRALNG